MKKLLIALILMLFTPIISIAQENKHKRDKEKAICISKCEYNYQIRECVYDAHEKWEQEINNYIKKIKKLYWRLFLTMSEQCIMI